MCHMWSWPAEGRIPLQCCSRLYSWYKNVRGPSRNKQRVIWRLSFPRSLTHVKGHAAQREWEPPHKENPVGSQIQESRGFFHAGFLCSSVISSGSSLALFQSLRTAGFATGVTRSLVLLGLWLENDLNPEEKSQHLAGGPDFIHQSRVCGRLWDLISDNTTFLQSAGILWSLWRRVRQNPVGISPPEESQEGKEGAEFSSLDHFDLI